MSFSEKIQKLRKEKGLSQERLAEMLDVSRQAVSKWESGQTYPEIDKLIKLSDLFNVTLDELVRNENISSTFNIEDKNKINDSENKEDNTDKNQKDEEDEEDSEDWIATAGFCIGVAMGMITGDLMWITGCGFLGIGLSYIIKGITKKA